jgi:hypothetical protein
VIGTKNNGDTPVWSKEYIITLPAMIPTISVINDSTKIDVTNNATVPVQTPMVINTKFTNDYQLGEYQKTTYQWYEYNNIGKLD